jgi:hypothetical protein
VNIDPNDVSAIIHFKNGVMQKEEFYYGSSFLSQSSRFILVTKNISAVDIISRSGKTRKISF